MTIVVILINIFLMGLLATRVRRQLSLSFSSVFWPAFGVRQAAAVSIGMLYLVYYHGGGDTLVFFNNASMLSTFFYVDPGIYFEHLFTADLSQMIDADPRSLIFIKIVSVINIITFNNYFITALWFSLFSFICSFRLVAKLDQTFPSVRVPARIALLFVPSVLFWSSGILKETIAFGAVQILALYFLGFIRNEKVTFKGIIEIIGALILLSSLKYYWAAVLLPSMIAALIIKKLAPKKFITGWYLSVFALLCVGVSFTHPNFNLSRLLAVIVDNHNSYSGGYLIHYYNLSPNWVSILINSPLALFFGLFGPMINMSSIFTALASLENLTLLILLIWKIKSISMPVPENRLIVLTVLTYIIVLCIFLALSTPNLGTLSRYRVGFLSFFVLLILADHPILNFINGKPGNNIRS